MREVLFSVAESVNKYDLGSLELAISKLKTRGNLYCGINAVGSDGTIYLSNVGAKMTEFQWNDGILTGDVELLSTPVGVEILKSRHIAKWKLKTNGHFCDGYYVVHEILGFEWSL